MIVRVSRQLEAIEAVTEMADAIRVMPSVRDNPPLLMIALMVLNSSVTDIILGSASQKNRHRALVRDMIGLPHADRPPPEFVRFIWTVANVVEWAQ